MGKWKLALAVVITALIACPAFAQGERRKGGAGGQGRPGMGGGMMGMGPAQLIMQKSVQEEIKVTEEQMKKLTEMGQQMMKAMADARENASGDREAMMKAMGELRAKNEKAMAEILNGDQVKRLKQIGWQLAARNQGLTAVLGVPEVAKELGLSDDQKEKLQAIQRDVREAMAEMFQGGGGGDREAMQKKMEEFRKSNDSKITKMLSDEQKTKWKAMLGAEFKGEITMPRRPGGGN